MPHSVVPETTFQRFSFLRAVATTANGTTSNNCTSFGTYSYVWTLRQCTNSRNIFGFVLTHQHSSSAQIFFLRLNIINGHPGLSSRFRYKQMTVPFVIILINRLSCNDNWRHAQSSSEQIKTPNPENEIVTCRPRATCNSALNVSGCDQIQCSVFSSSRLCRKTRKELK